jgi:hypothetical protein
VGLKRGEVSTGFNTLTIEDKNISFYVTEDPYTSLANTSNIPTEIKTIDFTNKTYQGILPSELQAQLEQMYEGDLSNVQYTTNKSGNTIFIEKINDDLSGILDSQRDISSAILTAEEEKQIELKEQELDELASIITITPQNLEYNSTLDAYILDDAKNVIFKVGIKNYKGQPVSFSQISNPEEFREFRDDLNPEERIFSNAIIQEIIDSPTTKNKGKKHREIKDKS